MRTKLIATAVCTVLLLAGAAVAYAKTRTVPSGLVNHRLSVVERKLDAKGIGFKTKGGGLFGIVVKGDWGVCVTQPAAGKPIHGPITLVVGHFTCGA
jgi:hypothetical protein